MMLARSSLNRLMVPAVTRHCHTFSTNHIWNWKEVNASKDINITATSNVVELICSQLNTVYEPFDHVVVCQISANNTYFSNTSRMTKYFQFLATNFSKVYVYDPYPGLKWNYMAKDICVETYMKFRQNHSGLDEYVSNLQNKCITKAKKQAKKDSKGYLNALDQLPSNIRSKIYHLEWFDMVEKHNLYQNCLM
eukprot:87466_1